jgi:hypothetical protein
VETLSGVNRGIKAEVLFIIIEAPPYKDGQSNMDTERLDQPDSAVSSKAAIRVENNLVSNSRFVNLNS